MLIIPAIDIRKGKCVRLKQGKMEQETIYSNDPVFMAKLWKAQGATHLHVIDLDGAFRGVVQNLGIMERIKKEADVHVTVGGGIRDMGTMKEVLGKGIDNIVLGTAAIYNPDLVKSAVARFGEKIIVAIDVFRDKVAIGGWKDITSIKSRDLAIEMQNIGVKRLLFTDIKRDGMLSGPNIKAIKEISEAVDIPVIASGGVSSLDDIKAIKKLEPLGVEAVVIGKALYAESFTLSEAIRIS